METNISLFTAFIAGLLSFASPCVLPLLSGYLVFISGTGSGGGGTGNGEETGAAATLFPFSKRQLNVVVSTLFFVLGFSAVFVVLSVIIYGFIAFVGGAGRILNIVSGGLIMVLGLNILFNFIPFLKYDDKSTSCETCTPKHSLLAANAAKEGSLLHPSRRPRGLPGSFIAGLAFGAGWTPCVGAFLGSILLMASQSGKLALSALYLAVYAAGLGLPFLVAAFFWNALMDQVRKARRILPVIRIISGLFLVATGLLMALGRFLLLNAFIQMNAYRLSLWAQSGTPGVQLIPALVFLLFAALPPAISLAKKKIPPAPLILVLSATFLLLAAASALGLVNCADYLSRWLGYSGI
ncbi:MAG: cytochrome c biogenesis protein CcdA [Spirochaetaceae bacterium]|jgi:cytochrome c-type biogenesis protein|nr:cytochrome c biogenesis protein CcdA [Spirochaetaceae bacterium]